MESLKIVIRTKRSRDADDEYPIDCPEAKRSCSVEELFDAIECCNVEQARMALDRGVPVDSRNACAQTALCVACINGSIEIVDLLLSRGAHINECAYNGMSPLHYACQEHTVQHTSLAKMLLDQGASTRRTVRMPFSPLEYANDSVRSYYESKSL